MPKGRPLLDLSHGKTCPRCKETKPLTEFYKSKSTKHGYQVYCKPCVLAQHDAWRKNNLDKAAAASKKWRTDNPKRYKDHDLKTRYGLPHGEYDKMYTAQNGVCAICNKPSKNGRGALHVDHCHSSSRIRGLLCHGCNVSLGHFNHSTQILEAAIKYLNQTTH